MVNKSQTGMQGVYLVAAELTGLGFIVSVTSRNAFGADLLVTDQQCNNAWSVQVKTNYEPRTFWLLNRHAKEITSPTHIYVFVNLMGSDRPKFYFVRAEFVAKHTCVEETKSGTWYSFGISDANSHLNSWKDVFGDPGPAPEPQHEPSEQNPN